MNQKDFRMSQIEHLTLNLLKLVSLQFFLKHRHIIGSNLPKWHHKKTSLPIKIISSVLTNDIFKTIEVSATKVQHKTKISGQSCYNNGSSSMEASILYLKSLKLFIV